MSNLQANINSMFGTFLNLAKMRQIAEAKNAPAPKKPSDVVKKGEEKAVEQAAEQVVAAGSAPTVRPSAAEIGAQRLADFRTQDDAMKQTITHFERPEYGLAAWEKMYGGKS